MSRKEFFGNKRGSGVVLYPDFGLVRSSQSGRIPVEVTGDKVVQCDFVKREVIKEETMQARLHRTGRNLITAGVVVAGVIVGAGGVYDLMKVQDGEKMLERIEKINPPPTRKQL